MNETLTSSFCGVQLDNSFSAFCSVVPDLRGLFRMIREVEEIVDEQSLTPSMRQLSTDTGPGNWRTTNIETQDIPPLSLFLTRVVPEKTLHVKNKRISECEIGLVHLQSITINRVSIDIRTCILINELLGYFESILSTEKQLPVLLIFSIFRSEVNWAWKVKHFVSECLCLWLW